MKMKNLASIALSLIMLLGLFAAPSLASAYSADAEATGDVVESQEHNGSQHNINYNKVTGSTYYQILPTVTQGAHTGGAPVAGYYIIDLSQEKLFAASGIPEGFAATHMSTDGGKKWKAVSIPEDGLDISKILNKESEIQLATAYDSKNKKPLEGEAGKTEGDVIIDAVPGSHVYKFEKLGARPKTPKMVTDFAAFADATGTTNGQWTLTGEGVALDKLNIAVAADDKKNPDAASWGFFYANDTEATAAGTVPGIHVQDNDGSKAVKYTYLVRTAPDMGATLKTPASKAKKLSVSSILKAPNFKIDYKKENIKIKDGTLYILATENADYNENGLSGGQYLWNVDENNKPILVSGKEAAKAGILIKSGASDLSGSTLALRQTATAKKPASAVQFISVADRSQIFQSELPPAITITNGKVKVNKLYEIYNSDKEKWGSLSKPAANKEYQIRLKNAAKFKNGETTGLPSSESIVIKFIEGTYGSGKKEKTGIIGYTVVSYPRYDGLVDAVLPVNAQQTYETDPAGFAKTEGGFPTSYTFILNLPGNTLDGKAIEDGLFVAGNPVSGKVGVFAEISGSNTSVSNPEVALGTLSDGRIEVTVTVTKGDFQAGEASLKLVLKNYEDEKLVMADKFLSAEISLVFAVPEHTPEFELTDVTAEVSGSANGSASKAGELDKAPLITLESSSLAGNASLSALKHKEEGYTLSTDGATFSETVSVTPDSSALYVKDPSGNIYSFRLSAVKYINTAKNTNANLSAFGLKIYTTETLWSAKVGTPVQSPGDEVTSQGQITMSFGSRNGITIVPELSDDSDGATVNYYFDSGKTGISSTTVFMPIDGKINVSNDSWLWIQVIAENEVNTNYYRYQIYAN